jgi:hypothetical protein
MLPEQAQDAIFGSADAFVTQPRPDLPIAFSGEDGGRQQLANLGYELVIGPHFGAALLRILRMPLPLASGVETGPRQVPYRGYPCHTIRLLAGRRNGAAHGFDFQDPKGRPFSMRAIFSRNSSFSLQPQIHSTESSQRAARPVQCLFTTDLCGMNMGRT